jgi:hypothetical protein
MKLGELLAHISNHSATLSLFLPAEQEWNSDTQCNLVELDPYNEESRNQPMDGTSYILGLEDVRSIVNNTRQQIPNANQDQLVEALIHYLDFDAYIDFSGNGS